MKINIKMIMKIIIKMIKKMINLFFRLLLLASFCLIIVVIMVAYPNFFGCEGFAEAVIFCDKPLV